MWAVEEFAFQADHRLRFVHSFSLCVFCCRVRRRVGSQSCKQASSIFFCRDACPGGPLQCCRGDGSSFSFSIVTRNAPLYRCTMEVAEGGGQSRTTLDKIKFTVPEQFLFFNAEPGCVPPSTVSIEGRGPCSHRVKLILSRLDGHVPFWSPLPRSLLPWP